MLFLLLGNGTPEALDSTDSPFETPAKKLTRDEIKSFNKKLRNQGKAYKDLKNNLHEAKKFKFVSCKCYYHCSSKLDRDARYEIFTNFWKCGNWVSQENFISHTCVKVDKKRAQVKNNSNIRKFTYNYFLRGIRVCMAVYAGTLGITRSRIGYCINKKVQNSSKVIFSDKRGSKKISSNSKYDQAVASIKDFLDKFPKYRSHYSSSENIYFHPSLTHKKIYELYENDESIPKKSKVKKTFFYKVFKIYNIAIYINRNDKCLQCDNFNIEFKNTLEESAREKIKDAQLQHQKEAEQARASLKILIKTPPKDEFLLAITFDMQKVMSLPHLNSSIVYFKRQLNVFNLGVHNLSNRKATFFLWNETQGRNGATEVANALNAYFDTVDLTKIKKIMSFSDTCGSQNRNRLMVAFMMYVCSTQNIDEWEHIYLDRGHSYLPNDKDFSTIEKLKCHHMVYCQDDWLRMINSASDNFTAMEMHGKFNDYTPLLNNLDFSNPDNNNDNFSFLNLKSFSVFNDSSSLIFRDSRLEDAPIKYIDFARQGADVNSFIDIKPFENRSIHITNSKYADLKYMTSKLLPSIARDFYLNLPFKFKDDTSSVDYIYCDENDELEPEKNQCS